MVKPREGISAGFSLSTEVSSEMMSGLRLLSALAAATLVAAAPAVAQAGPQDDHRANQR